MVQHLLRGSLVFWESPSDLLELKKTQIPGRDNNRVETQLNLIFSIHKV